MSEQRRKPKMNEWQQKFVQRLESAKKQWLQRFEQFASSVLEPAFARFDEFSTHLGFRVNSPACEQGTRLYKFALSENGYVLVSFRLRGLQEAEVSCEPYVPGIGRSEPHQAHIDLCDADSTWVEQQFQAGLDRFVAAFGAAGSKESTREREAVPA